MKPVKHASCNSVLLGGAPHVPDLHVRRGNDSDDDSMPITASYWVPTPDELAQLVAGGAVEVVALGYTHPPISIRVAP